MKYVGIQTQIWRNNTRSILLLIAFPLEILLITWLFFMYLPNAENSDMTYGEANSMFLGTAPFVIGVVAIWFIVAWSSHTSMIKKATGTKPLERKENMRVYNLVENLSISRGLKTPKINIIEDDSLNAFASGISPNTYTISLSRGIIDKLDDDELEAVIAHELTHIMNKDVRLLIISIIFVGIFTFIGELFLRPRPGRRIRSRSSSSSSGKDKGGGGAIIVIILLLILGYVMSLLTRMALSRKREFMADAGAVELTKKPEALASALRKIKEDPIIEAVKRDDVAQMFIEHPKKKGGMFAFFTNLFATHPPIDKRIEVLEQF